jgi:hypothetical protein
VKQTVLDSAFPAEFHSCPKTYLQCIDTCMKKPAGQNACAEKCMSGYKCGTQFAKVEHKKAEVAKSAAPAKEAVVSSAGRMAVSAVAVAGAFMAVF